MVGFHRVDKDLCLKDVAALGAAQGPMLEAPTRRNNALHGHTALASRAARALCRSGRQFGRG